MTETTTPTAAAPTLTNVGSRPTTPRKLFVNIPVGDLQRAVDFFTKLGFTFNAQFTDETATCMLVGEDAYFMLLTRAKFQGFSPRAIHDPARATAAMFALTCATRDEVDELVRTALAAGGSPAAEPIDHGFMYGHSFYDPDGHHWEVFWMDPAAVQ